MSERRRSFFLPLIGLTLLFAVLGPAIGGALFAPLAVLIGAPHAAGATAAVAATAALFGHGLAMVFAYVLGVGPAAATGFLYALWDAAAPAGAPRALAAAIVGGVIVYLAYLWLAGLGAAAEAGLGDFSPEFAAWVESAFPRGFEVAARDALVACGAVAGFGCAAIAGLIGLTTCGGLAPAEREA